jgi:hypothetical protein
MPINRSLLWANACPGRAISDKLTGSDGIVKADVRHTSSHRIALSQLGICCVGRQPLSCTIEANATGAPIETATSFAATAEMLIVNAISAAMNKLTRRWENLLRMRDSLLRRVNERNTDCGIVIFAAGWSYRSGSCCTQAPHTLGPISGKELQAFHPFALR